MRVVTFSDTPVLENEFVRLEPLGLEHEAELSNAVAIGELWRTWYTQIPSPETMAANIEEKLNKQAAGEFAPWAIIDLSTNVAVGVTSYLNLDPENRRLEIGSTWISTPFQGSNTNVAAKLLLLTRAFEDLACIAVELRTHVSNEQSRAAISKLGAKQDGILRKHRILDDGSIRDTVVFSIIDSEWPTVREVLSSRLARGA